jgi:hypothetical protein
MMNLLTRAGQSNELAPLWALWVVMLCAVALATLAPSTASAQEAPIQVQVRAIHVSNQGQGVDPALTDLKGSLTKGFEGYTRFRALSTVDATIAPGAAHQFTVPGDKTLEIRYRDAPNGLIRLGLNIPDGFKTNVRVSRGNTFFQAGLPYQDGVLVLAIKVK